MEAELQAALDAARRAGAIILDAYERFEAVPDARADISTDADRRSQEAILACLRERFPADALCAEEQTPTLAAAPRAGARLWIVDPIDGTRGFAKKNGEFSVMVAFVQDGEIGVGVVLEPALRRQTWAVRETYSAGLKLALVARGEVDLYVNTYAAFHDWDICAGHILVTEAGGRVTGLRGEELRYGTEGAWQRHGLLATNGLLHDASLEGLQKG